MSRINPDWEVSVWDVKGMLDKGEDFLLLDVRRPEEHAISHIQGARLVPLADLPSRLEQIRELAADRPIIAHCHHGVRSLNAAAILREAGVAQVKSMAGGIDAWAAHVDQSVPRYS